MFGRKQVDDLRLQPVRVLVFVDQNVLKLFSIYICDLLLLHEQAFNV
jgi:hypothetical protein